MKHLRPSERRSRRRALAYRAPDAHKSPHMPNESFRSSRWTRGNFIFPTTIEITDKAVVRHKRSFFTRDEMSMSIFKVASVHIRTGMVWSDIRIESTGGSDAIASHGHRKEDARRIKQLIEERQAEPANRPVR